jgi:hypothetical protein
MGTIDQIVDRALGAFLTAFSGWSRALPLALLAAAAGLGMLWVFSKTSDPAKVKAAKRRIHAALLELRVFADEPSVTWQAQGSLLAANLRYLALSLKPALWLALPIAFLILHLEPFYGRAPLPLQSESIVTMGMAPTWNARSPAPQLAAPREVQVEGPPVRVADAREITWRLRPTAECSGELRFMVDGAVAAARIEAGTRWRAVAGRQRVHAAPAEWIEIRYPQAAFTVFGFSVSWLLWFAAVSMLAAVLLRKRFGVVL